MRYEVRHTTCYEYDQPVAVSQHLARLTPRTLAHQRCLNHSVTITPTPTIIHRHDDYFGNETLVFSVERAHSQLEVTSRSLVELDIPDWPVATATVPWEVIAAQCHGDQVTPALTAAEFAFSSPLAEGQKSFALYALESFKPECPVLEAVLDLTRRIHQEFKFDPQATTVATPLDQVFRQKRGVCQDFAHFQIACLRSLRLPARYVSGYLETLPPPGKSKLVGADASHAWVQVWCGMHGWIDVDPTNNILPSGRHITVAWGRDYGDVAPIRGVLVGSGRHDLKVAVDVTQIES